MRTILFDPVNGAAGDMITGALLAAGADREAVIQAMASLVQTPETSVVTRCGIRATYVKTHAKEGRRTLEEVLTHLRGSDTTEDVKEMAERVFSRIHTAETRVHGEHAHFHEVGADDAIADVIGACTALLSLRPDAVAILPLPLGRGTIRSAHGIMPVPAPATAYILEESDLLTKRTGEETGELVTPTGAALLAEFRTSFPEGDENGTITAIGYGAGTRNPKDHPNVLRVMILETKESRPVVDILETNVDDTDGEVIAYTISRLHREGARDASAAPIIMKKGRPGHLIRVICRREDSERLAGVMADELGTLGVRCIPSVHRFIAERLVITIRIPEGDEIGVKIGYSHGKIISVKAEFDAVAAAAERHGLSIRDVKRRAEEIAYRELEGWKADE